MRHRGVGCHCQAQYRTFWDTDISKGLYVYVLTGTQRLRCAALRAHCRDPGSGVLSRVSCRGSCVGPERALHEMHRPAYIGLLNRAAGPAAATVIQSAARTFYNTFCFVFERGRYQQRQKKARPVFSAAKWKHGKSQPSCTGY